MSSKLIITRVIGEKSDGDSTVKECEQKVIELHDGDYVTLIEEGEKVMFSWPTN